jgi:hypothetical protein
LLGLILIQPLVNWGGGFLPGEMTSPGRMVTVNHLSSKCWIAI